MLEALFNKFIYLPSEGKLRWVFTELQVNLSPHLFTNFNWLFYSNKLKNNSYNFITGDFFSGVGGGVINMIYKRVFRTS